MSWDVFLLVFLGVLLVCLGVLLVCLGVLLVFLGVLLVCLGVLLVFFGLLLDFLESSGRMWCMCYCKSARWWFGVFASFCLWC